MPRGRDLGRGLAQSREGDLPTPQLWRSGGGANLVQICATWCILPTSATENVELNV